MRQWVGLEEKSKKRKEKKEKKVLGRAWKRRKRNKIYGGPIDIKQKSEDELKRLKAAGLGIIYLGLESGLAEILKRVKKGATPQLMIDAAQKVKRANIPLSAI